MSSGSTCAKTLGAWLCALSSACGVAQARASRCVVTEPHLRLENLQVLAPGVSFAVGVDDVAASLELAAPTGDARIEVNGPLRFSAAHPQRDLPLRVAQPVAAFGGRVWLGAGAAPHWLGVEGDAILASLETMIHVGLEDPLAVPCSHVGVSRGEPYASPRQVFASRERRGTGSSFFPLFLEPREVLIFQKFNHM